MDIFPRALVGLGRLKARRRACISEHPISGVCSNVTGVASIPHHLWPLTCISHISPTLADF